MPQLSGSYQYGYDALSRLTEVTKRPLAMYNVYSSRIGLCYGWGVTKSYAAGKRIYGYC